MRLEHRGYSAGVATQFSAQETLFVSVEVSIRESG